MIAMALFGNACVSYCVIPAKAGTHHALRLSESMTAILRQMGSGLRRDDAALSDAIQS